IAAVEIDQLAPSFFHGIGINGPADLDLRLLRQLLGANPFVAQIFNVSNDRSLSDLKDYDAPGVRSLIGWLHVDKPAARHEGSHVALHESGIERTPDAG